MSYEQLALMREITVKQIRQRIEDIDEQTNCALKREMEIRLKDDVLKSLENKYVGSQLAKKIKMARLCHV